MTDKMLKFVKIGQQNPPKRDVLNRKEDFKFNLIALLNNKFFVIFLSPFLLGALTTLSFSPYNLTIINFFTFSILLYLILIVKRKTETTYRKKKK